MDRLQTLICHPGTQHAPRLAAELQRRSLLGGFHTGFALGEDSRILPYLPAGLRSRIETRICRGLPAAKIHTGRFNEWRALLAMARGGPGEEVFHRRNEAFQSAIPDPVLREADAIVGFDTSSWVLAKRCLRLKKPFLLEQSVAHPLAKQAALDRAMQQFPAWAPRMGRRPAWLLEAEQEEHQCATRIVVGSEYCRNTLTMHGVEEDKIRVIPYGVESVSRAPTAAPRKRGEKLTFVFAGFLSLRKGVPCLLEAWRKVGLRDARLVLAGGVLPEHSALLPALAGVTYAGSLSRAALREILAEADVFVLPSYSEGFPIALIEALAAGLPAVTTEAGANAVVEGVSGLITASGDIDALVERLRWFASNREKIPAMSEAARIKAKEFTWERYGDRYETMLRELCS